MNDKAVSVARRKERKYMAIIFMEGFEEYGSTPPDFSFPYSQELHNALFNSGLDYEVNAFYIIMNNEEDFNAARFLI